MSTANHVRRESGQQPSADPDLRESPARQPTVAGSNVGLFALSLATSALLWLAHFPVACGWLAWVALVPLLALVRSAAPPRRIYLAAWVGGLAFFWPALQWMRVADYRMYATWAGLATYCSVFFPLAIFLLRKLDQHTRWPLVLTVPAVWTALEYLRGTFLTGFSWYFLGHTQHALLTVIQISDVTGAYGVTFLVAAVNALVFELLFQHAGLRRRLARPLEVLPRSGRSLTFDAAGVLVAVAAVVVYGTVRLHQEAFTDGPRVALIQGNVDQRIRNEAAERQEVAEDMVKHYARLSDQAVAQRPAPDLLVWPETSYPDPWIEAPPGQPDSYSRELAKTVADRWHTDVLLGLNSELQESGRPTVRHNSALLVRADGRVVGRYDKIHRVPFGEYVPLKDWLPWMSSFAPYDFDYSIRPGDEQTRFRSGWHQFGALICYEDTDPVLARQFVRGDVAPVDFLVNISNDGWFNGTSEHEEHLAICRFRAVESRRAVARAVNMGVSAVIDGSGRVVALPAPTWAASKKVAAVLTAVVPLDRRTSLYARLGDWLPWSCWLLIAVGVLPAFLSRRPETPRSGLPD